jgi:hypothetical protein
MTLRRFVWRYPHWWVVAASAAAWGWLLLRSGRGHHRHELALVDWSLMVGAMMLPLVFDHLRVTAARSLWRRRQQAIAGFLCGYAAIALLAGALVLAAAGGIVPHGAAPAGLVPAAFVLAAAWQVSSVKRRALKACHATRPLAPSGWRAHRDCFMYGWTIGARCFVSCAALMVACTLAGHSLAAMMIATSLAVAERVSRRADGRLTGAVLVLMAAVQLVDLP